MAQQNDAYTYEAVYNLLSFKNNMVISKMSEHTSFIKKNMLLLHFTLLRQIIRNIHVGLTLMEETGRHKLMKSKGLCKEGQLICSSSGKKCKFIAQKYAGKCFCKGWRLEMCKSTSTNRVTLGCYNIWMDSSMYTLT